MSALSQLWVVRIGNSRRTAAGDFVERANNTTLEDRPEAFNRVGMDRARDILAGGRRMTWSSNRYQGRDRLPIRP